MDIRRCLMQVAAVGALLASTGCVADEVVYVDAQGREVAVDAEGRPMLPPPQPAHATERVPATRVAEERPAPALPTPAQTPARPASRVAADGGNAAPAPDPSWDLAPARSTTPATAPRGSASAAPVRSVGASSDLDRPPAG